MNKYLFKGLVIGISSISTFILFIVSTILSMVLWVNISKTHSGYMWGLFSLHILLAILLIYKGQFMSGYKKYIFLAIGITLLLSPLLLSMIEIIVFGSKLCFGLTCPYFIYSNSNRVIGE